MQKINHFFRRLSNWWLYGLGAIPLLWMFWRGLSNQLGADPIGALIDFYGITALQLLVATLAVTPLKRVGIELAKQRRPLGLLAFFYALAHLLIWIVFELRIDFARVIEEVIKRPFVTLGMTAFLLMIPLAFTSNNRALRKLGPIKWRKLHKLTYPLALIAGLHYLLVVKAWPIEPFLYLGGICTLLAFRFKRKTKKSAA